MRNMMTLSKTLLAGLTVLVASCAAAPVTAQTMKRVYAGGESGNYFKLFCPPIPKALAAADFDGYTCVTSKGTGDNMELVLKDKDGIGLAQLDEFLKKQAANPEKYKNLVIVRELGIMEALVLVTANKTVTNFGAVQGRAMRTNFLLTEKGSGGVGTFETAQELDKGKDGLDLADPSKIRYASGGLADVIEGLRPNEYGFGVMFVDPKSKAAETILKKELNLVPVWSEAMQEYKVNGRNVYFYAEFDLTSGGLFSKAKKFKTAGVPVVIFTQKAEAFTERRENLNRKAMIEKIASISEASFLPQDSFYASLIKATKDGMTTAAAEAKALAQKVKETAQDAMRN